MSDVLSQEELDALLGALSAPAASSPTDPRILGPVGRVPLGVCAEVGRARLTIGQLLKLQPGTVLRLDRPTASRAQLTVHGRAYAQGEVVVIGEHYGLRITQNTTR